MISLPSPCCPLLTDPQPTPPAQVLHPVVLLQQSMQGLSGSHRYGASSAQPFAGGGSFHRFTRPNSADSTTLQGGVPLPLPARTPGSGVTRSGTPATECIDDSADTHRDSRSDSAIMERSV